MRSRVLVLTFGVPLACAPGSRGSDGDGSGSGSDEGSTADSETAGPTLTSASSGPVTLSTTMQTTTGVETGAVDTSSESDGDTSTGTTECLDGGVYRGALFFGGLDRVRIFRRDDASGTCFWMTLISPVNESQYDAVTPMGWALEQVWWNEVPESCDTEDPSVSGANAVPDAFGTISFEPAPPELPCSVDLDLQLQLLENPDPAVIVELCEEMIELGC